MEPRRKLTFIALSVIVCLLAIAATSVWIAYGYFDKPVAQPGKSYDFSIHKGESFRKVCRRLEDIGGLKSKYLLLVLARLENLDRDVKYGRYQLNTSMTPREVLEAITEGGAFQFKLTVPEGYDIMMIQEMLRTKSQVAGAQEFLSMAMSSGIARNLGIEANSVEGYLFPDTYYFNEGVKPEEIIERMVANFFHQLKQIPQIPANISKNELHQKVTLASLIIKEAQLDSEKKLIAAVYLNRLAKGMRLQCDPTVIYALKLMGIFDGNIRKTDLSLEHPYNTYKYKSLPPGPIGNPGLASLEAAFHPAQVDYLYFVARKDGSHHFSKSYREHTNAVNKYQKK